MFYKRLQFVANIILFLFVLTVSAISKPSSTQGRHFIIGFVQNEIPRPDLQLTYYASIFVSPTQADTLTIRIGGEATQVVAIPANSIYEIKLNDTMEVIACGINKNKLIDIRSRHAIVCWAYSSKNQSSDGFVALPAGVWGDEYRVVSMPNDKYDGKERLYRDNVTDESGNIINQAKYEEHLTARSGEFLIMASLNGTVVNYYPTCDTRNGVLFSQTGTVTLNAGECFLVQALEGDIGSQDLTGTLISSNNPIGVISGHVRTAVLQSLDNPYDTKDHLLEMLPPTNTWGRKFISVPFVDGRNVSTSNYRLLCASGDMIKVIAKEDNTTITYSIHNDDNTFTKHIKNIAKAGEVFTIETAQPVLWESDKPIMISQFMMHKGLRDESLYYDPSYVILTPTEQYMEEVSFSTPSNNKIFEQYESHCFITITDSVGLKNLRYDGQALEGQAAIWAKQIGNSEYYWVMHVVKNGAHKLLASQGKFSGIIYGHGYRDSYAMTLGSRLTDPFKEDTIPPVLAIDDSCGKVNITISDIAQNDSNATGIDWGYIRNVNNYDVKQFNITDTSTVVEITATPSDKTKDASLDIEFIDKNYNIVRRHISYSGFNFSYNATHNLGMLKWDSPTNATLVLVNKSSTAKRLLSIAQPANDRLGAQPDVSVPSDIAPNDTIKLAVTFTPDGNLTAVNTELYLQFECDLITIKLTGRISAPGLLADDLDFHKVRLYESKTLIGKLQNAGNVNLKVENIIKDIDEKAFAWQQSKPFPLALPIGDSLNYTVTFTPTELKTYTVNSIVSNDNNATCQFYVQGIGASPNIEEVVIDWGRRRLGTTNDTIINIINSGNFDDTLQYSKEISLTHLADLSRDSITKILNLIVAENSNQKLALAYHPEDTTYMENVFELASSWVHHRPILVTVKAQGTLPVIQAFDYSFGNAPIYSTQDAQHNAVFSAGNETLTIDSIVLLGGDANSFVIDYSRLYNIFVEPQNYLTIPISFKPTFAGTHKIYLEITSDANPNYLRSKDTIEITGVCVTDNADLLTDLQLSPVLSCQSQQAILALSNKGSADIYIDSIVLSQQPVAIDATINLNGAIPKILATNEQLNFTIDIYAEREQNTDLNIDIYYNSGSVRHISQPIVPQTVPIQSLLSVSKSNVIPGDTLQLHCQATIAQKSEKPFDYEIKLYFNKKLFYCLEKNCYISVTSDLKNQIFETKIEQYDDYVEFDLTTAQFEINEDNTTIDFVIPLLALLDPIKSAEFVFELSSPRCYDELPASIDVQIDSLCADNLYNFNFDDFSYMSINQNPVSDKIDITINLMESDDVTFTITNILGNKFYHNRQKLAKGKHELFIPLQNFNNGEYFITADSKQLNTTHKILIIK